MTGEAFADAANCFSQCRAPARPATRTPHDISLDPPLHHPRNNVTNVTTVTTVTNVTNVTTVTTKRSPVMARNAVFTAPALVSRRCQTMGC